MDTTAYMQFVAALGLVIGLILVLAWALRRYGGAIHGIPKPGAHRRLAVVEAMQVDPKRRLVLVRRDGKEHLLLLGAGHETVVETGIDPVEAAAGRNSDANREAGVSRPEAKLTRMFRGANAGAKRSTRPGGAPEQARDAS